MSCELPMEMQAALSLLKSCFPTPALTWAENCSCKVSHFLTGLAIKTSRSQNQRPAPAAETGPAQGGLGQCPDPPGLTPQKWAAA